MTDGAVLSLTWPQALAWRLRRQLLDPVGTTSAEEVVATLGAVAGQLDPSSAELGIRTRRRASRSGDVARALAAGELVSTFAFRGATHLMTPESASVHLALRAASRMWERPGWQSYYGLVPEDWPRLRALVRAVLADGPLTRAEVAAVVVRDPRFGHLGAALTDPSATILKPLAWLGDLSLGPSRDGAMTLQSLAKNPRWTGPLRVDEAGPRAVEAYLRAYGPATPENLHYWLGEGLGARRTVIREWTVRAGQVRPVDVDGEPRLALHEDLDGLAAASPTDTVRLLPRYDQWVMGPGTGDVHVVPRDCRSQVSGGADLVVVGGAVVGTWSLRGDTVAISSWPGAARPAPGDLATEVARLAGIVGRPLDHSIP